jgi:hypothetical protein
MKKKPGIIFVRVAANQIDGGASPFTVPDFFNTSSYYQDGWSPGSEANERSKWVDRVHPHLTREERKSLSSGVIGLSWAVERDYRLHFTICSYLKESLRKDSNRIRIVRSNGSMADGVEWKITIPAIARGERTLWVRKKFRKRFASNRIDEFTPLVLLLSENVNDSCLSTIHDSNITKRLMELGETKSPQRGYPSPDSVYSVSYAATEMSSILDGHIRLNRVTGISFLCTSLLMGVDRYNIIAKRPRRYQCRTGAYSDPELEGFSVSEKLIGWAVKYAERLVIVCAYPGWAPTKRTEALAKKHGVQITVLPLSRISKDFVSRLTYMHFISTPLKKHPRREAILRRFVQ